MPRSPTPTFPTNASWPAATPPWPTNAPANAPDLLAATENLFAPILTAVAEGRLTGADQIGLKLGKVMGKYKMAKHFTIAITDASLAITRNQASIDAEAALDGIYVIRTSVSADILDPADVVVAYKNLSHVERDWRNIKVDDLDLRPIHHWLEDRVKAHVLICMLAQYLVWHLRHALAPLTYTDEQPPTRDNPVAPAQRSTTAARKASRHLDEHDQPLLQLPRPARPPSHPHPQRDPLRPRRQHPRRAHAGHLDPDPAPRLRTPRRDRARSPSRSQKAQHPQTQPRTRNRRSTRSSTTARHWEDHVTSA